MSFLGVMFAPPDFINFNENWMKSVCPTHYWDTGGAPGWGWRWGFN